MTFNSLEDWLSWQETLHVQSIDMGLDRIRPVYDKLLPHGLACKTIVVGGTNGKGSTAAFLEAIYVAAGYKVGVYASPHLFRYNERIRLDGEPVSDIMLCEAFEQINVQREQVSLTYFEFGTLAAFAIFQQAQLDIAILEVGLGGRLDAVNLVDTDIAIVTNVDLDHMAWLGDTREKIAYEKFGIARPGKPLLFADDRSPENLNELVASSQCHLQQIGKDFGFVKNADNWQWWGAGKHLYSLPFPALHGIHQFKNAATALMAIQHLSEELPVSMAHIRVGLSKALLPGRFEVVQREGYWIILDVAHNPHGVAAFVHQLAQMPQLGEHHLVLGMLEDKDVETVVQLLEPVVDHWYLGGLSVPRGLAVDKLARRVENVTQKAKELAVFGTVTAAMKAALENLKANDKLLVLGSFNTVEAAYRYLNEQQSQQFRLNG